MDLLPLDLQPIATWLYRTARALIMSGKEARPHVFGIRLTKPFTVPVHFEWNGTPDDHQHVQEVINEIFHLSDGIGDNAIEIDVVAYVSEMFKIKNLPNIERRPDDFANRNEAIIIEIQTRDKRDYHIEADIMRHPNRIGPMMIYRQQNTTSQ